MLFDFLIAEYYYNKLKIFINFLEQIDQKTLFGKKQFLLTFLKKKKINLSFFYCF